MVFFIHTILWHQLSITPPSCILCCRPFSPVCCLVYLGVLLNDITHGLWPYISVIHLSVSILTDAIIYCRLIMLAPQKQCSSISKLVELSTGWQSWLTSLGSQKVLLMLNFWNKKLSRKLWTWMNRNCMVDRLRLRRRGLMSLGWSSVHHAGIIPTMATLIDHMEHRTSPHTVMGGLLDSAALCATDLTSEVRAG